MIDIKKQYKHLLLLVMVILFLTGCFSESINKRISRSLGIEIPKDIKIEYEDTHGGFHGDGETVAVVEFNNSIGEDIQSEMLNNEDWELAMYGDFMFDLAGLHFWSSHLEFPQKVRNLWLESGQDIINFKERLHCYMLFKAVDGLRFYAKQGAKPSYDYIREKVVTLLNEV